MWTLTYSGRKAGVVINERCTYEFDSLESARNAVKEASQIYVETQQGQGQFFELSANVKQSMRVIPPQSYPVE